MSPSSAGRQRRSLPRSGSPSWGAFLFGQRAGAFGRTGRKSGDASGKIPTVAASAYRGKGACRQTVHAGGRSALPSVPLNGRHRSFTGGRRPARRERSGSLPPGLAICGLLVYGSSFIEAHSGSGPGCPAMRYGAFFVVFRSWGRGRRQAGLQGLGRCGRSQPFWRIEKWLTSA